MSDPSPEVVAAALALAEADAFHYAHKDNKAAHDAHMKALDRYRAAIAPKRMRAERDADIVRAAMRAVGAEPGDGELAGWHELLRLCREETAPETETPQECERCQDSRHPKHPDLARLLRRLHRETQSCDRPCKDGDCDWHDLQRVVRAFTTLSEDAQSAAYDCIDEDRKR